MPTNKKVQLPVVQPIDLSHLTFDSTNKIDYLEKKASIRGGEAFLTAPMLVEMEETWGGSFTAVKTITDTVDERVYVFPAGPKETENVVAVNKSDTFANATFAFTNPLKKLKLKLRSDRQIVLVPFPVPVMNMPTAYCFDFKGVRPTKRPRAEEQGSAGAGAGTTTAKAKSKATASKSTSSAATGTESKEA